MLLSSPYARLSHFRLNSGTGGIGALSFGAKFKLALGSLTASEFGDDANWLSNRSPHSESLLFFFSSSSSSSSYEARRTSCAYESRSAAPLLIDSWMRHERSQNICYGHEERKVTAGITQARRARYLLSSWHSHLSNWARQ